MRMPGLLAAFVLSATLGTLSAREAMAVPLHHRLTVTLDPLRGALEVRDTLTLPAPAGSGVRFVLHAGLKPEVVGSGWRLAPAEGGVDETFFGINAATEHLAEKPSLEAFTLTPERGAAPEVTLHYAGVIHHALATSGEEYQRSFSETAGIIDVQGVFLSGTSFWVPRLDREPVTFELTASGLPAGWDAVSQGKRTAHERTAAQTTVTWSCQVPSEEVYLVAGPWTEYHDAAGPVELYAFLRSADDALASKYLAATKRYLALYESFLPPFPFPSFALVENFWETGYGMPGFTLLGSKVIRFPWILTSSYPHELLHNWWGNSVYVAEVGGNWCEGLTAYLADHLFAEQRGEGATYRRDTLKRFTDFAAGDNDTPLAAFSSRHSAASEAVGYGKSLMLFHMLRMRMGDAGFVAALGSFYREHAFKRSSFDDLASAFSAQAGEDLRPFVAAWVRRPGAPRVAIDRADVTFDAPAKLFRTAVTLKQDQAEEPFPLRVPVAVTCAGGDTPVEGIASFTGREARVEVSCGGQPLRLDVDPAFDVMRRLHPEEVAPTLSGLFGDDAPVYVLPTLASEAERTAWQELARSWQQGKKPPRFVPDVAKDLPSGNVWVLGWSNAFGQTIVSALSAQGVTHASEGIGVPGRGVARAGESLLLVARYPGQPGRSMAWLAADPAAAIPGLGRKLPHYTKYGYLVFRGEAPDNIAKGTFEAVSSPLVHVLEPSALTVRPRFAPRRALASMPPELDLARLAATARWLSDPAREGRGLGSPGLDATTSYVERALAEAGLEGGGSAGFRQSFPWHGGSPARDLILTNLVGRLPGSDPALQDHPVLLLAHLDHLGRGWPDVRAGNEGQIHPGADDNASGVSVLLELARALAAEPRAPRPVVFAFTTGEEAGLLGSRHLLGAWPGDKLPTACVCLDTVGRLRDGKLYSLDTATARELPFIMMGAAATVGAPIATPAERLDSSDQTACIEHGVPGVQLFAGPTADYHRPGDTADKLDIEGMEKVAEVTREVVVYLAGRAEPLHPITGAGGATPGPAPAAPSQGRASLGTMPDFAFPGPGVKVAQVMAGSAAELAGVKAGDVVLALGEKKLATLKDLSEALKAHSAGERVDVVVLRDGREQRLAATLQAR
jgi:aminopeptidase N